VASVRRGGAVRQRSTHLIGIFCALLAAVPEIAAWGIRHRRFWGWVLGVILFGLYIPSLFLPLGAFGLWGLLDRGSREEFGVGVTPPRPEPI
jgi:hypothetical protein